MTRTVLAVAAALTLAACGGTEDDPPNLDTSSWPAVESLHRLTDGVPECDAPWDVTGGPDDTFHYCVFKNVLLRGEPRCWVTVVYRREMADQRTGELTPWFLLTEVPSVAVRVENACRYP
jgi:hypothetical protein